MAAAQGPHDRAIERVHAHVLRYCHFMTQFAFPNRPVILTDATVSWGAVREWTQPRIVSSAGATVRKDGDMVPDWPRFARFWKRVAADDSSVSVAVCDEKDFTDQRRIVMPLAQFCTNMTLPGEERPLHYLKDFHFVRILSSSVASDGARSVAPRVNAVYRVPPAFADDWMNEDADARSLDDFRFLYAGPAGSWTPLHVDVYKSYSWSANVAGWKVWFLFPDVCDGRRGHLLRKEGKSELVYSILPFCDADMLERKMRSACCNVSVADVRLVLAALRSHHGLRDAPVECGGDEAHVALQKRIRECVMRHCQIVLQKSGEAIFVPSGYVHEVYNVRDCISINHNWANGACILACWSHLKKERQLVVKSLTSIMFDGVNPTLSSIEELMHHHCGVSVAEWIFFLVSCATLCLRGRDYQRRLCTCGDGDACEERTVVFPRSLISLHLVMQSVIEFLRQCDGKDSLGCHLLALTVFSGLTRAVHDA